MLRELHISHGSSVQNTGDNTRKMCQGTWLTRSKQKVEIINKTAPFASPDLNGRWDENGDYFDKNNERFAELDLMERLSNSIKNAR